jgi:alkanesulfonate monooxygenase SsuD/methylene tetrahydromethanopterin reductase-like flavin-dependent oxidoreductase (luciferase family)
MTSLTFGAFFPQGWKMELASVDGAENKWQTALEIAELIEDLGYDSIWLYDHFHNVPRPAHEAVFECWMTAAALSQATSRIRIGQMVGCNSYRHPSVLAKMTSTFDVISGGRLDWGIGAGWYENEYKGYGFDFPAPKDRIGMLRESVEIVKSMWTEPETTYKGKYYELSRAHCDPKPLQQPHPPIWIPSQGSTETVEWSAERRYPYLQTFNTIATLRRNLGLYKEAARQCGYEAPPEQLGWAVPIYVAPTDEEAHAQAKPHIEFFFNCLLRYPPEYGFPPGYLTERSMATVLAQKVGDRAANRTFEAMNAEGYIIAGSPATVTRRLAEVQAEIGYGLLVAFLQFGSLPADLTRQNMELFAREVMPALRPLGAVAAAV